MVLKHFNPCNLPLSRAGVWLVIDGSDWDAMIEWLETVEDLQAARTAFA